MKVLKIEKSRRFYERKVNETGGVVKQTIYSKANRAGSFSQLENQPFTDLKKQIIEN